MTDTNTIDLDAIVVRRVRASDDGTVSAAVASCLDVLPLVAEVRRLQALDDAATQESRRVRELLAESSDAFDRLVVNVWKEATGGDHEGPASVEDMLATLRKMRATARREGAEAMREACADLCDARARRDRTAGGRGALERAADAINALPLPEVTP